MCPPYIDANWRQTSFPDSHFYRESSLKYVFVQLCANDEIPYLYHDGVSNQFLFEIVIVMNVE